MYNGYAGKENVLIGKPVVKDSDIDRVKRNLSVPLQTRNHFENNNNAAKTPVLLTSRRCVNSPVTELAYNFTELAAHESSNDNTPKRRLSLASSSGSPTPDFCRTRGCLKSSVGLEVSSCSSNDSDADTRPPNGTAQNSLDIKFELPPLNTDSRKRRTQFSNGAFKRYNSMPVGSTYHNEASPPFSQPSSRAQGIISPLALPQQSLSQSSASFYLGNDEASRDSQDSGIDKDEDRFCYIQDENRGEFLAPAVPPERTQATNEQSPVAKRNHRRMLSPELHNQTLQHSSDSPLLDHQLCSHSEDDDGFIDLDYLEKQGANNDIPASIANMLTGKMLATSQPLQPTPKAKPVMSFSGKLFRSPSMPQQLSTVSGYDIRRRVLCGGKRPDPPNGSTPSAAVKKRRGVISDGDLKPTPQFSDHNSANRLLRCRSMVEQTVSFQRSKGDNEGLTGDGKKCCLPLTKGEKPDLNNISHETMSRLLNGEFEDVVSHYTVIDCRYPYEYEGGHIKGAENIYTKEDIFNTFLSQFKPKTNKGDNERSILIFHCEFSSERAPKLSRFLRNWDRETNQEYYPNLFHPELYLLEGGYKVFYEYHKDLCEPAGYTPMAHKDFADDLKTFRAKSKSWAGDEKRGRFRTGMASKKL